MSGGKDCTDDAQVTEDSDALTKLRALLRIVDTLPYHEHPDGDNLAARLREVPGVSSSEAGDAEAEEAEAQSLAAEAWEWAFTEAWVAVERKRGASAFLSIMRLMAAVASDGTAEQVAAVLRLRPQAATECGGGCWRYFTGYSVLHCAAQWRWEGTPESAAAVVRALVEHKAHVGARDEDGWTPLHCAAGWNDGKPETVAAVVRALVEHKAQVDAQDNDGKTPLHRAAGWNKGKPETVQALVRALVELNADVTATDPEGKTAYRMRNDGPTAALLHLLECNTTPTANGEYKDSVPAMPCPPALAELLNHESCKRHDGLHTALCRLRDEAIGLDSIKDAVASVVSTRIFGGGVKFSNFALQGATGTGKSHIARLIGEVLIAARCLDQPARDSERPRHPEPLELGSTVASSVEKTAQSVLDYLNTLGVDTNAKTSTSHIAQFVNSVNSHIELKMDSRGELTQGERPRPQYVHMHESDIVAGYEGQTPQKVIDFLNAHKGDVLFFDEANKLVSGSKNGSGFGAKAVSTWMSWLEKNPGIDKKGRSRAAQTATCIVAGYPKDLQQHFFCDEGFSARFNILPELPPLQPGTLWSICLAKLRQWREQIPLPGPTVLQAIESAVTLAAQKGLFTSKKQGSVAALFANAHGTGDKLPEFAQQVHFRRLIRNGCQADNHSYAWCYADFYDALVAMAESGQGQRKDYSRIKAELERDLPPVEPGVDDVCGIGAEGEMQIDAGVRYQPLQHTTQHEYLRSGVFDGTCRHCKKNAEQCKEWSELLATTCARENCVKLEHCIDRADMLLRSSRGDHVLKQYATYKLLAPATSMLDDDTLGAAIGAILKQKLQDAVARLREVIQRKAPSAANGVRGGAGEVGGDTGNTEPETSGLGEAAHQPSAALAHSPRAATVAIAHQIAPEVASGAQQSQELHERMEALTAELAAARKGAEDAAARAQMAEEARNAAERHRQTAQREKATAQRAKEAAERRSQIAQREKEAAQREKEAAERRSEIAQREKEEAQRQKEEAQREKVAAQLQKEVAIQEKNAVQAVLTATRQRIHKVVAVARAVAAVAASLLSFVWAIGLATTLGLAFWPATAVVIAIVAVTALVCCIVVCGTCSVCAGADSVLRCPCVHRSCIASASIYCGGSYVLPCGFSGCCGNC